MLRASVGHDGDSLTNNRHLLSIDRCRHVVFLVRWNRHAGGIFAACERCQPTISSRVYARGGVLVPSEHHIAAFHEWVAARLGDTPR